MPEVWILNHYAIAPDSSGSTRHYDLARGLLLNGWIVKIVASAFEHQTGADRLAGKRIGFLSQIIDGVEFVWVRTLVYRGNGPKRVLNMFTYSVRALIFGLKQTRPDIIIGSSLHPFAALVAYVLSRWHGCKFYFEVRDLWPQTMIELGEISEKSLLVWLLRYIERFLYEKANKIVAVLPAIRDYVRQYGVTPEKIVFIPNGVNLELFDLNERAVPVDIFNKVKTLDSKFIAIYTGAHGLANELHTIIDAAAILNEKQNSVHFLLIGEGPLKPSLEERARKLALSNITFLPPVEKGCVPTILKMASVGLICLKPTSLYRYGISLNKSFDYMAAGLPVVMTGTGEGNPVELAGAGIVLPGRSPEALATTLSELAVNQEIINEMGKRGMEYVERNHSTQVLALKLHHLMSEDVALCRKK